jgi:uncharacterized protein (TIGR02594 family)
MKNNDILKIALTQYGVKEVPGEGHNETILQYFDEIGHELVNDDETAWCSCFMNWVAMKAGAERSGKLNARSWLLVGDEISEPVPGDVVIFWRETPESWKGHVGIFLSFDQDGENIWVLGGNQSNMVCAKKYQRVRLLGYRRLTNG